MDSFFQLYGKDDVVAMTRVRRYETKLGECIQVVTDPQDPAASLQQATARYVLIGIPEDIGVKANGGTGGAETAWFPFLNAFLNIQSNDFLNGQELLLLGHFDFTSLHEVIEDNAHGYEEKLDAYRHAVVRVDEAVEEVVRMVTQNGKIPIVIGGGHNNAYPLIKGTAKGLYKAGLIPLAQINCINLDAHSDYRPLEGRHSGNAFRYAEEDGYLQKYCMIGIHENYLQQNVWMDIVNNPFFDLITYEDIFLHEKRNFMQAVAHATGFTEDGYTGIDLDLDSIENVLASAGTPCGITTREARQYINFAATDTRPAYLHLCEGASLLNDGRRNEAVGKLISYLVSDFVKSHTQTPC
ncbi:MAG TPA: formimidoylglutamase [Lacibacter sp.]|nr:formimidoylglutamase [Lacibacter sp.]HMO90353.1 formimidoylglutamase [Lacibacter sp.]HMP88316.1 formimidoylglutamase [Lacibacter sp.]